MELISKVIGAEPGHFNSYFSEAFESCYTGFKGIRGVCRQQRVSRHIDWHKVEV